MTSEVDEYRKNDSAKESNLKHLAEKLDNKTRACLDAEVSLKHLDKTLEDLRVNFDRAKEHADLVMNDNDSLRNDNNALKNTVEI